MIITFTIPVKTVSESNAHEHWRARAGRARKQRTAARRCAEFAAQTQSVLQPVPSPPIVVHMTRVGVRKLDSDNLQGSCKHVRDGIADWLGIDDGRDDLVTWEYAQETGKADAVGVRVTVRGGT